MTMQISLVKKPKKLDRKQVKQALHFFANELMNSQLVKNLNIQVMFIKNLDNAGYCDYEDCGPGKPRYFNIEIDDNMTKQETLLTLGHEMVHVKQYATGEMKEYIRHPNRVRWHGRFIKLDPKIYMYGKYEDYPFEHEALRVEKTLYEKLKKADIIND